MFSTWVWTHSICGTTLPHGTDAAWKESGRYLLCVCLRVLLRKSFGIWLETYCGRGILQFTQFFSALVLSMRCLVNLTFVLQTQFPPPHVPGLKPPFQNSPYGHGPMFQTPPPVSQDCNDSLSGKMGLADWSAPYDSTQGGSRLPNHHTGTQSGPSPSPSSSSDGDEPNDSNAK